MLSLIRRGRDSVLKVLVGALPASVFGVFVGLVPVAVALGALVGTMALKEAALDNMAGVVADRAAEVNTTLASDSVEFADWSAAISDQPAVQRRAAQIDYLKAFPMNLIEDPGAAMMGVSTVDYSSMAEGMKADYEARQAIRDERTAALEEEAASLRAEVAKEESERSTYTVERSADGGETWSVVAQGLERSGYVDAGLASGEAYSIACRRATARQQRPGNVAVAYTRSADIVRPAGVRARTEETSVVLNWNDQDWNEEGFTVERQIGDGDWSNLANLPANGTSYVDESVQDTLYVPGEGVPWRRCIRAGADVGKVRPSLASPRSSVETANASSAVVVWSHNTAYRSVERGGDSTDGDGEALTFEGQSRLEALQARLAEVMADWISSKPIQKKMPPPFAPDSMCWLPCRPRKRRTSPCASWLSCSACGPWRSSPVRLCAPSWRIPVA